MAQEFNQSTSMAYSYMLLRHQRSFRIRVMKVFLTLALASYQSGEAQGQSPTTNDEDDYQVYSAVVRAISKDVAGTPVLIDNQTIMLPRFMQGDPHSDAFHGKLFPAIKEETLKAFFEANRNENHRPLSPDRFSLSGRLVVLENPFGQLPRGIQYQKEKFKELQSQYSGAKGVLYFSRIGFSRKKDQAYLLWGINKGEGSALYATLLQKSNRGWYVKRKKTLGVS